MRVNNINVMLLLTPKANWAYLDETQSVRQALEKMRFHHFTAIPLISKEEGLYLGTLSEGDFLWYILDNHKDMEALEKIKVKELLRKDYMKAVSINVDIREVIECAIKQNFVPVVDDRGVLVGIVTRKAVISHFTNEIRKGILEDEHSFSW